MYSGRLHRPIRNWVAGIIFLPLISITIAAGGSPIQFGAGDIAWPGRWVPLPELNDPADNVSPIRLENDFVGNASAPAAFYAVDNDFVFFRVRVRAWTVDISDVPSPLFSGGAFWIFINPFDDSNPRYALAWDAKSRPYYNHGLEMMVNDEDESLTAWDQIRMNDWDGNAGVKIAPPDFRSHSADGFIRLVSLQPTAGYGNTTFIDWAISKQYLAANVPDLLVHHDWQINFVSRTDGTDHDAPNADVAGGALVSDAIRYSRKIDISASTP